MVPADATRPAAANSWPRHGLPGTPSGTSRRGTPARFEAVLDAAEAESAPVILGFGAMMVDGAWLDGGGIEVLGAIGRTYAARSAVDVALLFNEAHTLEQAMRGIDAGFNAVMIDTHSWPTEDAIVAVRELCRVAHQSGVAVEGELGSPAEATASGVDHSHERLTDPDEAARFVEETGVDCLAVSVGNVHIAHGPRGRRSTWSVCARSTSASTCRSSSTAAPASRLGGGAGDRARSREVQCRHHPQARVLGWSRVRGPRRRRSTRCAPAARVPQGLRCDGCRAGADDREGALADPAVRGKRPRCCSTSR